MIVGCALLFLSLLALSASARAQSVPSAGQGTWDGKCYDKYGHQKPCGASSGSSSASPGETAEERQRREAAAEAKQRKKEAKEAKKKAQEDAQQEVERQAELARQQQIRAQQQAELDAERQRLQEAETRRRQAAFEVLKQGSMGKLKGFDDAASTPGSAANIFGLKDADDSSVVDMRTGNDQNRAPETVAKSAGQSAWVATITDPQAAILAKKLGAIVPPLPIPQEDAPDTWQNIVLSHPEGELKTADYLMAGWEMVAPQAAKSIPALHGIMIVGKTVIASEDGAALYFIRKDEAYDAAMSYLKNPALAQQFARLVQEIRQGHAVPEHTDPFMLEAAHAIADPGLNGNSTLIALKAMVSPEALAAAARAAAIEYASGFIGDKAGEGLKAITGNKAVFTQVCAEREAAAKAAEDMASSKATRDQMKIVVDQADKLLDHMYRVEKASNGPVGLSIGDATDKIAQFMLGEEAKPAESK
jgi:hypothetical protein